MATGWQPVYDGDAAHEPQRSAAQKLCTSILTKGGILSSPR